MSIMINEYIVRKTYYRGFMIKSNKYKRKEFMAFTMVCLLMLFWCKVSYADDTVNIGVPKVLDQLDEKFNPLKITTSHQMPVVRDLHESLMTNNSIGETIKGIAESWSVSGDKLTYTFILRDNANWSDGTPIIAADFVLAFRHLFAENKFAAKNLLAIPGGQDLVDGNPVADDSFGVIAVDAKTLMVKLTEPILSFENFTNDIMLAPMPSELIKKVGEDWRNPKNFISSGPYTVNFTESEAGKKTVYSKNPYYWDANNVAIDNINYLAIKKEANMVRLILKETLDAVYSFSSHQHKLLSRKMPEYIRSTPRLKACYISVNHQAEGLNDIRVRRALTTAFDRHVMVKSMEDPSSHALNTVLPNLVGYKSTKFIQYNPEKALALMEEAGYTKENQLNITMTAFSKTSEKRITSYLRSRWKRINVKLEASFINDFKTVIDNMASGNYHVGNFCWSPSFETFNIAYIAMKGGSVNYGKWYSDDFERINNQLKTIVDMNERYRLIAQAEKIMLDDVAIIPLIRKNTLALVHPDLEGWDNNISDIHLSRWLSWKK